MLTSSSPSNDLHLLKTPENLFDGCPHAGILVTLDLHKRQFGCAQINLSLLPSCDQPVKRIGLRRLVVLCDCRDDVVVWVDLHLSEPLFIRAAKSSRTPTWRPRASA